VKRVVELPEAPAFDRAAHRRADLDHLERALDAPETLLLPTWRNLTLVRTERIALVSADAGAELIERADELVWLGELEGRACFGLDLSPVEEPLALPPLQRAGEFQDLRQAGPVLPVTDFGLAAYARGILHWHARHRHCAVCGSPTAPREGGHSRECRDESCRSKHFPRTDPAVIVLVHDGDRCLLGRQARWPAGMYSTLAGFVEPGETMEQAVAREVAEETGVRVAEPRYFRSQPWPFPASLMIGFIARAESREIDLGDDELEDAAWFTREQVQSAREHGFFVPGRFALSGQLIEAFLAGET
jgi:NAD+ diphosphatase